MRQPQEQIPPLTVGMERVQEHFGRSIAELLVEDYDRMTIDEMAVKYDVSRQSVLNWMVRLGIPRRAPSKPPPWRVNGR